MNVMTVDKIENTLKKIAEVQNTYDKAAKRHIHPASRHVINVTNRVIDELIFVSRIEYEKNNRINLIYTNGFNNFKITIAKDHILLTGHRESLKNVKNAYCNFINKISIVNGEMPYTYINACILYYCGVHRNEVEDFCATNGIYISHDYAQALTDIINSNQCIKYRKEVNLSPAT